MTSSGDAPLSKRQAAEAALERVRQNFLKDLPNTWSDLRSAISASNAANEDVELRSRAIHSAHRLNGTAGSLNLRQLTDIASELEDTLESIASVGLPDRPQLWCRIQEIIQKGDSCVHALCCHDPVIE